jgi:hypothetical protein
MDDKEKSIFENFADTIKHTFDTAAEAANKPLEPEPLKPDEEVVVMPNLLPVSADLITPTPLMTVVVKKTRRATSKKAKKAPAAEKSAKKSSKRKVAKVAPKKAKKSAVRKSARFTARKAKKAKKSKR